jgi:hypothetical protein
MRRFGERRISSWLGAAVVGLVTLVVAATASASHPTLSHSSTFDSGAEGWSAGAGPGPVAPMTWQSTGGNPNGYVTTDFSGGIGFVESLPGAAGSTWSAGNALGDYGGTLGADFRVQLGGTSGTEFLQVAFLSSNAWDPACGASVVPTSSWAPYAVTLNTSHLTDCDTERPLTGAEVSAALAGFERMIVLVGNFDGVAETVDVDNAVLSALGVPVTPPAGNIAREITLRHKVHKLTGSLVATDDFSCAGKMKVTIFKKGKKPVKIGTVRASAQVYRGDTVTPAATFGFTLKRSAKGKFYASAAKKTSTLDGNSCHAATSKSVTIRCRQPGAATSRRRPHDPDQQRELKPDEERVEVDCLVEAVGGETEPEGRAVREREVGDECDAGEQCRRPSHPRSCAASPEGSRRAAPW